MELFIVMEQHGLNLGEMRPVAAFATEAEAEQEVKRLADIAHEEGFAYYNVGNCGYWVASVEYKQATVEQKQRDIACACEWRHAPLDIGGCVCGCHAAPSM